MNKIKKDKEKKKIVVSSSINNEMFHVAGGGETVAIISGPSSNPYSSMCLLGRISYLCMEYQW